MLTGYTFNIVSRVPDAQPLEAKPIKKIMTKPEDVAKLLPLNDIYKDIAQPAAQQVGGALESTAKVARLLLAPIELLAANSDRWQRYLRRIAEQVPEENRIEAHPQIAGPVLECLRYTQEDNIISEMFINLLMRAVDRDRVSEAHPAFAQIIPRMSSDEAHIMFVLQKERHDYRLYAPYHEENHSYGAEIIRENKFPSKFIVFPENFIMYIDNLQSLNLIVMRTDGHEDIYEKDSNIKTGMIIKCFVELTKFGSLFAHACIPSQLPDSINS